MKNRYGMTIADKTDEVGILEYFGPMILRDYPIECDGLIHAICQHWNEEDRANIEAWRALESLDLSADPFTVGRQAVLIEAGCPYRAGTPEIAEFERGQFVQRAMMPRVIMLAVDIQRCYAELPAGNRMG